jgi:hypothetical protein
MKLQGTEKIWMISESALSRTIAERPQIAAKLLMNLSNILCGRVQAANASRLANLARPSEPTIAETAA